MEKAKEEFIKYTGKFNLQDENIDRKQQHSLRVMKISNQLAKELELNEEQIQLATLIGLLHDIGRFKQYTEIGLGDNIEGFDHGDYGAKVLFEEGIIRKFIDTNEYDEIIRKAIKNHNKFSIESGLTQEEMMFAKLIRDADKIDILYESVYIFYKNNEDMVNKSILSEKIYNEFMKKSSIKKEKNIILKYIDDIVCVLALIFDINYKPSFEILKKENLEAVYKVNEYLKIKDIDENKNISFNNGNIIMERDNNESNLLFNFVLDKETESKYFIKNLNFYIDTKVKTNHLQIDDDRIIIEYDLWLTDEYSGNFKYEIILKEV